MWEFFWIKNDPIFFLHRIVVMLLELIHKNPAAPRAITAQRKVGKLVTKTPVDASKAASAAVKTSEQTLWMIAIRDTRDRAAFAQLFDHFAPRLKGFIVRSGTSPSMAEEIVQDVMLTVWRKADMFDPHRAQVSAWIYQIARNRQIDVIRKEQRPVPEELGEDPESEPDASQILGVEQETKQIRQALSRLKPDQRDIIQKAYMGELSHQEISAQTGLPLGTIKSRIRLGLERLRHDLKELR